MTHRLYLNDDWLFTEQFEDSLMAPVRKPRFIILTNPSTRWSADTDAIS